MSNCWISSGAATIPPESPGGRNTEQPFLSSLAALDKPLHLQVFVTPTCPYCPPGQQAESFGATFLTDKVVG